MRLIFIILVLLFVLPNGLLAGGPCNQYPYQPYPQQVIVREVIKEVIAPVAVPVFVPSTVFQYLPAMQPQVAVTQPQMPNQNLDALIEQKLDALLNKRLAATTTNQEGPPPIQWGDFGSSINQPKPNVSAAADPNQLTNILRSSCISCHGNGKKAGGISLFDPQGNFAPNVTKAEILDSILGGRMPKNNPSALSQEQKLSLQAALSQ